MKHTPIKRKWNCSGCGVLQTGGKQSKRYCSQKCLMDARERGAVELKLQRTRSCAHCGAEFVAKKSQIDAGVGLYCSHRCAFDGGVHKYLFSSLIQEKAANNRRVSIASNGTRHGKGCDNANWKGGKDAALIRNRGKTRAYVREYRKNNREKVREFTRKRRGAMTGRLPSGTIKRIGAAQKWRCAVCKAGIKGQYHVDHIMPLARGGRHEPLNIQILCPTCNVRKSAKDPIAFMQERGFLL